MIFITTVSYFFYYEIFHHCQKCVGYMWIAAKCVWYCINYIIYVRMGSLTVFTNDDTYPLLTHVCKHTARESESNAFDIVITY